jgi:cytochrome c2
MTGVRIHRIVWRVAAVATFFVLSQHAQSQEAALRGELLVGDLNCIVCHDATPAARDRIAPRRAPKIGPSGLRITPQWIRAFLDNPQKINSRILMPDMLGGLPAQERADAIDALTHFIVSLHPWPPPATDASRAMIEKGRNLYHSIGCVACHAPVEPPPKTASDDRIKSQIAQAAADSVGLGDLARKFSVPDLAEFLQNPLKAHPSGRMPSFGLKDNGAIAAAMYLLREQIPPAGSKSRGLVFDYYGKVLQQPEDFEKASPDDSGTTEDVSLRPAKVNEYYSLRFRGNISIPKDGDYKFLTESDDGSWLFIDGKLIVDNGKDHAMFLKEGHVSLNAGDHAFTCLFFQGSSESGLTAQWESADIKRQEIPAAAFSHGDGEMKPVGAESFIVDTGKVVKGQALFTSLNCVICHERVGESGVMSAKSLAELNLARADGCLSANPAAGLPRYAISDADRDAIRKTLANAAQLSRPLAPAQQIERTMTALNCYACHARGQRGGVQGFRRDYFVTSDGNNISDPDRIPPSLDGIGSKCDAARISSLMIRPEKAHQNMTARMPEYIEDNIANLPEAFIKADQH